MLQVVHKFRNKHFDRGKPIAPSKHSNIKFQSIFTGGWQSLLIPTLAGLGLVSLLIVPEFAAAEGATELLADVGATGDISVTVGNSTISLDLTPGFTTPAFEAGNTTVTVGTRNVTGYTLTMSSTSDVLTKTGEGVNPPTIGTLSSTCNAGCDSDAFETNAWGYSIGSGNTSYKPFPGSSASYSTQVNGSGEGIGPTDGDVYTLNYAAKVNHEKTAGTYASTITFVAVANATPYTIHYNANSTSATGSISDTIMSDTNGTATTTLPSSGFSLANYELFGWNTAADGTGTAYATGADFTVDAGSTGETTLYAQWRRATRNVTVNFGGSGISSVAFVLADSIDNLQGTPATITTDSKTASSNGSTVALYSGATYNITASLGTSSEFANWSASSGTIGSTTTNPTTYIVPDSDTSTLTATGRSTGFAYNLTFNGNGGTPSTPSLEGTAASVTLPSATYRNASTTNTGTRYAEFAGWSETPNATTATYTGTMNLTAATTKTLYAVWTFNSGTLQNTSSTCGNNMIDARTGVSYLTYTINSKCYMEQNLFLPVNFTLYAGDSNIYNTNADKNKKASWTTPASSTMPSNSYDTPYIVTGTYTNNTNTATGAWYNYCAASAGTVCDSSTKEDAYSDVCPKGWRLPTDGEMGDVKNANRQNWKFYAGYYNNGSLQNASTYSYWWSATADSATYQYYLYYDNGSLNTDYNNKYIGFFVRCVRS